jgi:hypothetical protein
VYVSASAATTELLKRKPNGKSFSSSSDDMSMARLLWPGRIEGIEVSEKEDVDAKPGERSRGWFKGDTQMHLNSIRLGLVNFFPTGAVSQAGSNLRQAETKTRSCAFNRRLAACRTQLTRPLLSKELLP